MRRGRRNNLIAFALLFVDFAIGDGSSLIWRIVLGDLAASGGVDASIADCYGLLFQRHLIEFVAINIRIGKLEIGYISSHNKPIQIQV